MRRVRLNQNKRVSFRLLLFHQIKQRCRFLQLRNRRVYSLVKVMDFREADKGEDKDFHLKVLMEAKTHQRRVKVRI